jgi:hypothetical protein
MTTLVNLALFKPYTATPAFSDWVDYPTEFLGDADSAYQAASLGWLTNGDRGRNPDSTTFYDYNSWMADANPGTMVVRLDMESAVSGDHILVFGGYRNPSGPQMPTSIKLEYSDNDSDWTTVDDLTGLTQETVEDWGYWMSKHDISESGSHRYWRLSFGMSGDWLALASLEFWGAAT